MFRTENLWCSSRCGFDSICRFLVYFLIAVSLVSFQWTFYPSLQFSSFLSDMSNVRGVGKKRGIAVCSVAPNPPSNSTCRSEHSPAHKVSWEGEETREDGLERVREEREEEWGQRALELERTQRHDGRQGKTLCVNINTRTHRHGLIKMAEYSRP